MTWLISIVSALTVAGRISKSPNVQKEFNRLINILSSFRLDFKMLR